MSDNTIILLLIIAVIVVVIIYIKFRKPKKDVLNLYAGANGSGKTFSMTEDAVKAYYKSVSYWKRYNEPFLTKPLDLIPYFKNKRLNAEIYGLDKPVLYSTYPIKVHGKIISQNLTNDIMLLEKSIPLNSIVVIDECSGWIDQFEYKENFSIVLNDHLQKWRHYHGNKSRCFIADQCTNNIPIQIRYRCNKAVICQETKHYLHFLHITKYKCIELTDDIKTVEIVDKDASDTDDKVLRMVRFSIFRKYDDRAYSNRYFYVDGDVKHSKYINSPLKVDQTLLKPDKKKKYVSIDDYLLKQKELKQKEENQAKEENEKS